MEVECLTNNLTYILINSLKEKNGKNDLSEAIEFQGNTVYTHYFCFTDN